MNMQRLIMQNFFQGYPARIQELITALRTLICDAAPGAKEEIDPMANMLVFNLAPGFGGMIFNLIPTEEYVTVGFFGGATLPDPHGLMTGRGSLHRHVKISAVEQVNAAEFVELVRNAVKAAHERLQIP
jgi:hypothetical protein